MYFKNIVVQQKITLYSVCTLRILLFSKKTPCILHVLQKYCCSAKKHPVFWMCFKNIHRDAECNLLSRIRRHAEYKHLKMKKIITIIIVIIIIILIIIQAPENKDYLHLRQLKMCRLR